MWVWIAMNSCLLVYKCVIVNVCVCACVCARIMWDETVCWDHGGLEAPYGLCVAHRPLCSPLSPPLLHPFFSSLSSLSHYASLISHVLFLLLSTPHCSRLFFHTSSVSLCLSLMLYSPPQVCTLLSSYCHSLWCSLWLLNCFNPVIFFLFSFIFLVPVSNFLSQGFVSFN